MGGNECLNGRVAKARRESPLRVWVQRELRLVNKQKSTRLLDRECLQHKRE